MVAVMATAAREKTASLIKSAKFASDIPSKLNQLHRLSVELSHADATFLSALLPSLLDLVSDSFSPVRKYLIEMIGHIGLKHVQFFPEIVPVLITLLKDDTPAVARQTIKCAIEIFRCTLVKVAVQGMHSSELDEALESSWSWVQKLRDEIYSMAFQAASDGRRLLALKFVESVVLLYTPDPSSSPEPASDLNSEGISKEFNISWLRGGHPILNLGDLSIKASQSLGLLLDQLRFPTVKSLSNLMVIVLVKGLSTIAKKRPSFYGRILPVLLGLDRSSSAGNGVHRALKNAFLSCLNCTHSGAAPWRDRLAVALKEIDDGALVDKSPQIVAQSNGNVGLKNDPSVTQIILDEKPSTELLNDPHTSGKKRTGVQDKNELFDDETSGKRLKSMPAAPEGSTKELSGDQERVSPARATTSKSDGDNGPVQQLVAMFGALVAQGEKAVGSLEILISSISADLLAEVVMANIRNLPPNRPKAEDDEELLRNLGSYPSMVGSDTQFKHLSLLLKNTLAGSSSSPKEDTVIDTSPKEETILNTSPKEETIIDTQHSLPMELETERGEETVTVNAESELQAAPLVISISPEDAPSAMEDDCSVVASEVVDLGNVDNEIPGLDISVGGHGSQKPTFVSSLGSTNLEDDSQEHVSTSSRSLVESHPLMSTDRSEELSPKAAVVEVTSSSSSISMSLGVSKPLLLPKMSAPVIHLTDEQKNELQKSAFMRIIDAYKQIAIAGGSQVRSSILANLGFEFPVELDPWKLLQTHILADYVNHEGHELTLRVLYRLFGEAEEERDFFSSTTATSVYETFLLVVAETLKDSFPASDKSLGRLLCEVPYLPKSIFKLLECLCSPGSGDKDEKELHSGDRVTQGLSTVWNLIMLRPPNRDSCLKVALQSAVHHLEEVRMKAIRLVANKLYPIPSISQQIEDFAKEMLVSIANVDQATDLNDADGTNTELKKDVATGIPISGHQSATAVTKDTSSDAHQSSTSESLSTSSIAEIQRCMSLYFALCTKKHALFHQIFAIYKSTSKAVKQAFHRQIPMLVRTIGSSSELLGIISDPPSGSEDLLMQVLHTLTDGTVPSPELLSTIRKLYDTKLKDVDILIPILPFLQKDEVLLIFPQLVNTPLDKFQVVLSRVLQGASSSGPVLTPAEALIAIHGIDPDKDKIPLKKVTDACNACFEQREIFTQQVLAKVLNQLVEQIPLPLLFMRTVLQAIGAFPSLVDFIMEILSRLVSKQIWKNPKLWVGFVKCALLTKPQSFGVLLQLPPAQLENALHRTPALKAPLAAHVSQPHLRSSLPRSVLVALGVVSESQSSSQTQPTQPLGDTGNSDKEAVTEKSKESSSAS